MLLKRESLDLKMEQFNKKLVKPSHLKLELFLLKPESLYLRLERLF